MSMTIPHEISSLESKNAPTWTVELKELHQKIHKKIMRGENKSYYHGLAVYLYFLSC
jgi:hypothetical protein